MNCRLFQARKRVQILRNYSRESNTVRGYYSQAGTEIYKSGKCFNRERNVRYKDPKIGMAKFAFQTISRILRDRNKIVGNKRKSAEMIRYIYPPAWQRMLGNLLKYEEVA